jgi:hypothetical protein
MTDTTITAIEAAVSAVAPMEDIETGLRELERSVRDYRRELGNQDPNRSFRAWAELSRVSPTGFNKVMAVLPQAMKDQAVAYIESVGTGAIPAKPAILSVSQIKKLKLGGGLKVGG